ncbi:MAG: flagellar protein FliS [Lachnospiraceae bacterium]|nr:flagellar protein FliS [Lachnospiraceae bacterium]MEE3460522.1 flagellar protein FliS [Lachnospiraceae bacterium]
MDNEMIKDYTLKISGANKSRLTVIIFDIALEYTDEALGEFEKDSPDKEKAVNAMRKAQSFVAELRGSLDLSYGISFELLRLYRYVNQTLAGCIAREDANGLRSVKTVLNNLRKAFDKVADEDHSEPVIEKAEKIYAGLTYGKDRMDQISVDPAEYSKRGFMA